MLTHQWLAFFVLLSFNSSPQNLGNSQLQYLRKYHQKAALRSKHSFTLREERCRAPGLSCGKISRCAGLFLIISQCWPETRWLLAPLISSGGSHLGPDQKIAGGLSTPREAVVVSTKYLSESINTILHRCWTKKKKPLGNSRPNQPVLCFDQ